MIETNEVRCPDPEKAGEMRRLIETVKKEGDTVGGTITCVIKGCPAGLGEPVFDKLNARLGYAMLGINAAKGFEIGMGFNGCTKRGSEMNDIFYNGNGKIRTRTNNSGGVQGGLSNGEDIYFRVAFKPVATLLKDIETVDKNGNPATYYVYNNCSHHAAYEETGMQAVSYTTGVPAMIGAMMYLKGLWKRPGVWNVEEFDPDPFMAELNKQGLPWHEIFNGDLEL